MGPWAIPAVSLNLLICQMNTEVLVISHIAWYLWSHYLWSQFLLCLGHTLGILNSIPYIEG